MYQIIKRRVKEGLNLIGYHGSPNFLILGVEKGGTTGLYHTLSKHSKLVPSFKKEIDYFSNDSIYGDHAYYYHFFPLPHKLKNKLTYEGSHNYFTHEKALGRMKNFNPKMKFILSLRNPAHRMLSAWSMYSNKKHPSFDNRPFEQMVEEELDRFRNGLPECRQLYLSRGLYYNDISRAYDLFPRDQFLIIENKNLLDSPKPTFQRVCDFLGINFEDIEPEIHLTSKHNSKEEIYESELSTLQTFFKEPNKALFNLIETKFEW